jgi:hypothetical protein
MQGPNAWSAGSLPFFFKGDRDMKIHIFGIILPGILISRY